MECLAFPAAKSDTSAHWAFPDPWALLARLPRTHTHRKRGLSHLEEQLLSGQVPRALAGGARALAGGARPAHPIKALPERVAASGFVGPGAPG